MDNKVTWTEADLTEAWRKKCIHMIRRDMRIQDDELLTPAEQAAWDEGRKQRDG